MRIANPKERTEQALVLDAYKRIRAKGVPAMWEAPLLGRSVDIVYYYEDCLISVEFKLNDWKRAIRQARDHQVGADLAYVCMPKEPNLAFREAVTKDGIGILVFTDDDEWPFREAVPAVRSKRTWASLREQIKGSLKTKQIKLCQNL